MINIPWGNDFALKVPIKKKVIQTTGEIEIQDFDVSSVEQLHVFLQHNEHLPDWHSSQVEWSADPENSSGIIVEVSSQMAPIGMYNIILTGVQNGRRFFSQQCRQFKIIGNASSSDLVIYEGIQTYTLDEVIVLDARGRDGLSAYELAVARGFEGTESEWMATLKGENGNGVLGVELIEQVGNVDHYRMTFTDGTYFDYTVTNSSGNLTPEQIAEIVTEVSQIITAGDLNAYTKDEVNSLLNNKANASDLSSVATSGSYNDLINKPTIPDAQIQSDWNQTNTSAKDYIKNKPSIPQGVVVDNALSSTSENPVQNKVINSALGGKVDKVNGKGLSTNDYTNTEKDKLAGLQNYNDTEVRNLINAKYTKPSSGIPATDIASGVIPDVSQFITKSVNDLVNYYTKTETYTQSEVNSLIAGISGFEYEVVSTLPTASASTMHKIYLVPSSDPQTQNVKDEYITLESSGSYSWELIGNTSADLSGYVTTQDLNTALADYTTTTDLNTLLAGYQTKIDATHKLSYEYISNTPTIPDAQIQSDWNQTTTTAKDYIKNKPTIPSVVDALNSGSTTAALSANQGKVLNESKQDVIDSSHKLSADLVDDTGTTNKFVTASDISTWNGKESTSNKVTSISSSSTDTQYPSAKCVYDLVGDVETLLSSI